MYSDDLNFIAQIVSLTRKAELKISEYNHNQSFNKEMSIVKKLQFHTIRVRFKLSKSNLSLANLNRFGRTDGRNP